MAGLAGSKILPPVKKAKQVMLLVHGPPMSFYFLNYPKLATRAAIESTDYVKLFKRLG